MSTIKPLYGATVTLTVTNLHSLASGSTNAWKSASQDNSTNLYLDAHLIVKIVTGGSGASANDKGLTVYAYGSADQGTTYSEGLTASEATYTLPTDRGLVLVGFVPVTAISTTVVKGPMSVAAAFGGVLPQYWGLVILNNAGFTLSSSGNAVMWLPVQASVL